MRMNPEEKKELDDWVEKEYPKSMKRMEQSSPFHRIGKYLIGVGTVSYTHLRAHETLRSRMPSSA